MGFIDNFLDKMKLGSNYEDDDDYEGYDDVDEEDDDDEEDVVSSRRISRKSASESNVSSFTSDEPEDDEQPVRASKPKVTKIPRSSSRSSRSNSKVISMQEKRENMEVCVFKPTNMEDAKELAETLMSGIPVILNLDGIDADLAQRISDFTSGATYSLHGNLKRISSYIFLATPEAVNISGDVEEYATGSIYGSSNSIY